MWENELRTKTEVLLVGLLNWSFVSSLFWIGSTALERSSLKFENAPGQGLVLGWSGVFLHSLMCRMAPLPAEGTFLHVTYALSHQDWIAIICSMWGCP